MERNISSLLEHFDGISILFWLSLILMAKFFVFFLSAILKMVWLERLNFSKTEIVFFFSQRKTNFDLNSYIQKSSDRSLRLVDAIPRKLTHFFSSLANLLIVHHFIVSSALAGVSIALASLTFSVILLFLYSRDTLLARIIFGATSRIRDGKEGRKNYLVAQWLGFFCSIFVGGVVLFHLSYKGGISDQTLIILSYFVFLPMSVGDALGEIVGSFAKQNIPVKGIGEINRKSVVGTIAVFFRVVHFLRLGSLVLRFRPSLLCLTTYRFSCDNYRGIEST